MKHIADARVSDFIFYAFPFVSELLIIAYVHKIVIALEFPHLFDV